MRLPETGFIQERGWLFLIIMSGLALRVAAISLFSHTPVSDELAYQSMALNLIRGNGIVDWMGNHAMFNVGYALFVLAPIFALFDEDIFAARLLNALLGGLAILLCYAVAKEAGIGKIGRLLAAAMWALYLPASVNVVYLAKENLMIPLMLGVIWCALRLAKEPSYTASLGCGILFGLLALTGNAALSLAAPVAFALGFTSARLGRKLLLSLAILISAVVVATPWMVRNTQVLGAPVLNTNGGFNLYLGNNPAATGMFVSIADTPRGQTWDELRKEGEVLASDTLKGEAIAWIKDNPSTFITLALQKAALFWMPPFHGSKDQASKVESAVRVMWTLQFIILLAGAIGGVFVTNLRGRPMAVFWIAIASYTAVHMLFYVTFRYREPIMPLLCVLAAMTFQSFWDRWKYRRDHSGGALKRAVLVSNTE